MSTIAELLDNYADAVHDYVWAQDHGTHGDGRVKRARERVRECRVAIVDLFHA